MRDEKERDVFFTKIPTGTIMIMRRSDGETEVIRLYDDQLDELAQILDIDSQGSHSRFSSLFSGIAIDCFFFGLAIGMIIGWVVTR